MLIVLLDFLLVVCSVSAVKFRFMQKSIPRRDFVQRQPSNTNELHTLVFDVKQNNITLLEEQLVQRSTPGNVLYQQWLTFDEVEDITKNSAGVQEVISWLNVNSINITWTSVRQEYITAEAPISLWEELLNTKFYLFEDLSTISTKTLTGKHVHRATQYYLPDHLTEHVSAVFNTVQVPPIIPSNYYHPVRDTNPSSTTTATSSKKRTSATDGTVTIPFLNQLYQISSNTGLASQGQAVFQTLDQSYSPNDLALFQQRYNLPIQAALHPFGYNTTQCSYEKCGEGNLDTQYIMGIAQQTTTVYWHVPYTSGGTDPFLLWAMQVADTINPPLVHSISWGAVEQSMSEDTLIAFNTEALKLSIMGVTIVVATGDNGAAANANYCNLRSGSFDYGFWDGFPWFGRGYFPSYPASSPYVTAVGATMGPEKGNPEVACQSQLGGLITSGGGFSTYYPTPYWQEDAVVDYFYNLTTAQLPTSGFNPYGRGIPDVSLIGVNYQVFIQGQVGGVYGTSASAPVFAGMISLANALRASQNKSSLGFINPTLYSAGKSPATKHLFTDITSGHNKCMVYGTTCCNSGFTATHGWDPVTGLGSITFPNLLSVFVNVTVSLPPSARPTIAPSRKPSNFPTPVPSRTPSLIPSTTPSVDPTLVPSVDPSQLPSVVPSENPTATPTHPTQSPSFAPTVDPSAAPTILPSVIPSREPSVNPTAHPSTQPSVYPSVVPSTTPSETPSTSPSVDPSAQPSLLPSTVPTVKPSATPTVSPSALPTVEPSVSPSAVPTVQPSVVPSTTPTQEPSNPTNSPTLTPTIPLLAPTKAPSALPSVEPSVQPSVQPSVEPSVQPSLSPSVTPSVDPSVVPTIAPTVAPSGMPSVTPSANPSTHPSVYPTLQPSADPSVLPSVNPSTMPSTVPSLSPTVQPTAEPSDEASVVPSLTPSVNPTVSPSADPSAFPSALPTVESSSATSVVPSVDPSAAPSVCPSAAPSTLPSSPPSTLPTLMPSTSPSVAPSVAPSTAATSAAPSSAPLRQPTRQPTSASAVASELTFTSSVTLAGVSSAELSPAAQGALIQTTATAMNVSDTAVEYVGAVLVPLTGERRQLKDTTPKVKNNAQNLRSSNVWHSLSGGNKVVATTRTKLILVDTSTNAADAVYTLYTSQLQTFIETGDFTIRLRANAITAGAGDLASVTAENITFSDPQITAVSDTDNSSSGDALSTGAIVGIVIGGLAGILLVGGIVLFLYSQTSVAVSVGGTTMQPEVVCNAEIVTAKGCAADREAYVGENGVSKGGEGDANAAYEVRTAVPELAAASQLVSSSQDEIPYPGEIEVTIGQDNPQHVV